MRRTAAVVRRVGAQAKRSGESAPRWLRSGVR